MWKRSTERRLLFNPRRPRTGDEGVLSTRIPLSAFAQEPKLNWTTDQRSPRNRSSTGLLTNESITCIHTPSHTPQANNAFQLSSTGAGAPLAVLTRSHTQPVANARRALSIWEPKLDQPTKARPAPTIGIYQLQGLASKRRELARPTNELDCTWTMGASSTISPDPGASSTSCPLRSR